MLIQFEQQILKFQESARWKTMSEIIIADSLVRPGMIISHIVKKGNEFGKNFTLTKFIPDALFWESVISLCLTNSSYLYNVD